MNGFKGQGELSRPLGRRVVLGGLGALSAGLSASAMGRRPTRDAPDQTRWTFDRLSRIGGAATMVEGDPRLIDTPYGKAVQFDGVDDRLVIERHPLAGMAQFTFEALFRPDGGVFAQRWFHLNEEDPTPGAPPSVTRMLFEIRVTGEAWSLDAFATGPGYKQTLLFLDKTFPVGRWYWVAQSYDGKTYRAFVNGQLQGEVEMAFKPQGQGRSSVGARMNRVDYFKGAVREARFTPRALGPEALLRTSGD
ncbi:LamG-like jellyroll fold domain-containing protein [Caulobacter sp. BP25]|uniref:LamG-like jellyroll fold domain-containing protein n=1 Tax=Caulobacter sp. BP25 TaxID=2048900 RepID=UPI000C12B900|nr:LamG-like jellyroll fold domain-containing protein [Caulobacter sp. BP25]PHY17466.1 laminin G [Caulobacter sp. BP25]